MTKVHCIACNDGGCPGIENRAPAVDALIIAATAVLPGNVGHGQEWAWSDLKSALEKVKK